MTGSIGKDCAVSEPVPAVCLSDGFGDWLAGFVDGEGCFLIGSNGTRTVSPRFSLALREDDSAILGKIRERTGLGIVGHYHAPSMIAVGKPGRAVWQIYRKAECAALVEIFDRYPLRAKKARDFRIWRKAVMAHQRNAPGVQTYLRELGTLLSSVKTYDGELAEIPVQPDHPTLFKVA